MTNVEDQYIKELSDIMNDIALNRERTITGEKEYSKDSQYT